MIYLKRLLNFSHCGRIALGPCAKQCIEEMLSSSRFQVVSKRVGTVLAKGFVKRLGVVFVGSWRVATKCFVKCPEISVVGEFEPFREGCAPGREACTARTTLWCPFGCIELDGRWIMITARRYSLTVFGLRICISIHIHMSFRPS